MTLFLSAAALFLISFILSGALAAGVFTPVLGGMFGEGLRTAPGAASFASMIAGFLVLAIAAAWAFPNFMTGQAWLTRGVAFGALLWAIVLSQYAITAGWANLHVAATLISGALSGLPVFIGTLAMAWLQRQA